jgi:hypothetical protein
LGSEDAPLDPEEIRAALAAGMAAAAPDAAPKAPTPAPLRPAPETRISARPMDLAAQAAKAAAMQAELKTRLEREKAARSVPAVATESPVKPSQPVAFGRSLLAWLFPKRE